MTERLVVRVQPGEEVELRLPLATIIVRAGLEDQSRNPLDALDIRARRPADPKLRVSCTLAGGRFLQLVAGDRARAVPRCKLDVREDDSAASWTPPEEGA
jgi:hypothetical protein